MTGMCSVYTRMTEMLMLFSDATSHSAHEHTSGVSCFFFFTFFFFHFNSIPFFYFPVIFSFSLCSFLLLSLYVDMLPGKRCWVYSMGPRMKWAPQRRRSLVESPWLMPLLCKLQPKPLEMPAFNFNV